MEKLENKMKKCKKKKKMMDALWITVVIHSYFGCGGTVIPPHHLEY
jgi:hypothetical protein